MKSKYLTAVPPEDRSIGDLLAVDPGLNSPGAALFRGGVLIGADRVRVDKEWAKLDRGDRARRVASAILRWAMAYNAEPRFLVWEWPQWYNHAKGKSKADPNDLAGLVAVGASLDGQLSIALAGRDVTVSVITPTPAEWTGGLPKCTTGDPWESPRGARVAARLALVEREVCVGNHDSIDACALGLYALGRFEPVRVYPGAV